MKIKTHGRGGPQKKSYCGDGSKMKKNLMVGVAQK
tara:strand:- start:313 stop:417 length:105 start_codon:yes stop_codon:yes gene_type:complete